MDVLLLPFLQAPDETERERCLTDLLQVHAGPVVRQILRQRLNFYVNTNGLNPRQPDAEDLYQGILTKTLLTIQELAKTAITADIVNFKQYVARIAVNICHDYLRVQAPVRARLKKVIHDLLVRHQSFAIWQSGSETICGFSVWLDSSKSLLAERRLTDIAAQKGSIRAMVTLQNLADLSEVIAELFDKIGGPVELDGFVSVLSELLGLQELQLVSLDSEADYRWESQVVSKARAISPVDADETFGRLWTEILKLPTTQRDTFCFGFADSDGEDLFTLLLEAGVVIFPQLAQQLGRSSDEISRLWGEMPLDTAALGKLLNASPAQIYKWRFLALGKLREALKSVLPEK